MMNDRVLEAFLEKQQEEGMALARQSDILDLSALDGPVPQHYVATFHCNGLIQMHDGDIEAQSTPGGGTTFRVLLPQA